MLGWVRLGDRGKYESAYGFGFITKQMSFWICVLFLKSEPLCIANLVPFSSAWDR
jgi:hypothetical protein